MRQLKSIHIPLTRIVVVIRVNKTARRVKTSRARNISKNEGAVEAEKITKQ